MNKMTILSEDEDWEPDLVLLPQETIFVIVDAVRIDNAGFRVNKETLDRILSNDEILKLYKANVKRLNRWYWSVYFEKYE